MIKQLLSKIKTFYFPNKTEAPKMKIALTVTEIDSNTYTLTAYVTDDALAAQPLLGQTVNFVATNGTVDPIGITDADGKVSVTAIDVSGAVTATLADGTSVTVLLNTNKGMIAPTASDVPAVQPSITSELDKFKAQVAAIVAFVEHGVEVFGKDAEAELLAFKDKYL